MQPVLQCSVHNLCACTGAPSVQPPHHPAAPHRTGGHSPQASIARPWRPRRRPRRKRAHEPRCGDGGDCCCARVHCVGSRHQHACDQETYVQGRVPTSKLALQQLWRRRMARSTGLVCLVHQTVLNADVPRGRDCSILCWCGWCDTRPMHSVSVCSKHTQRWLHDLYGSAASGAERCKRLAHSNCSSGFGVSHALLEMRCL